MKPLSLFTQYRGLKKEIYILFIGSLVTSMGSFVGPLLTFFLTRTLSFSDGTATLIIATASLLMLPMSLLGGKLADRFSRKSIIIVFDLMTVTLYFTAAILPLGYHTVGFIFLAGLFQTIEGPAYDALSADFSTTKQRENAFSLSYLGHNLGYIVGAAVAGSLFETHFKLSFVINACGILISTLLITFFVNPKNAVGVQEEVEEVFGEYEKPVDESLSAWRVLLDRKTILWFLLVDCIVSMPENLVGVMFPLQLSASLDEAGAAIYGFLNSLNGFTVIVMTPILTSLFRRITEIPKVAMGMALYAVGMVLFIFDRTEWVLFLGMFIYTVGEVLAVIGGNPYASRRIPASHRGRIGGINSLIRGLFSSGAGYLISGVLIWTNSNYPLIWGIFIAEGVVAVGLFLLIYRADKKRFPKLYEKDRS